MTATEVSGTEVSGKNPSLFHLDLNTIRRIGSSVRDAALLATTLATVAMAGMLSAAQVGARFVITDSIPRGLYWPSNGRVARDTIVAGCLPLTVVDALIRTHHAMNGGCPGHVLPYVKVVAAISGDVVSENATGVYVNGAQWPWSRPLQRDSRGETLRSARRRYVVPAGDVLLLGVNPRSYDGRYFGPTPAKGLIPMRALVIESSVFATKFRSLADER